MTNLYKSKETVYFITYSSLGFYDYKQGIVDGTQDDSYVVKFDPVTIDGGTVYSGKLLLETELFPTEGDAIHATIERNEKALKELNITRGIIDSQITKLHQIIKD